jgi:hypothetical protein
MVFGIWFLAFFEWKTAKMAKFYLNRKNSYGFPNWRMAEGKWPIFE